MKKSGRMEKDLIDYIGLPAGTFSQWRRGNGYSYLRYIKEICTYFQVSPNYLFFGDEDKKKILYTKDEMDLIECYRKASEREKIVFKSTCS